MTLKQVDIRHTRVCETLPLPRDLAEMFMEDERPYKEFVTQFDGASKYFLRKRLAFGGELLFRDGGERIRLRIQEKRVHSIRRTLKTRGSVKCRRCKVLLGHPQVQAAGDMCAECAGTAPNHWTERFGVSGYALAGKGWR